MLAVSVKGVTKSFKSLQALEGLTVKVRPQEVYGIVGPDGAGKTTFLKILAGLLKNEAGSVEVLGIDLSLTSESNRPQLGYIPQRFSLYGDLSVIENVNFYAQLYQTDNLHASWTAHLIERVGLAPFKARLAAKLSGGMKQKLALACSLVHQPKLLIMDEPTVGVDPVSRREFWKLIFDLRQEGLTVIASTPYMDEAEQFDRLSLLNKGKILQEGTADEIKASFHYAVWEVAADDPFKARKLLQDLQGVKEVALFGNLLHLWSDKGDTSLPERLLGLGFVARRIAPTIEDIFLHLAENSK